MCDAVMSSSDSASTEESSGHSGKVRRLLLLDNEWGDEGRRVLKHRQCQIIHKSNVVLCSWDFIRRVFTQNVSTFSDSYCLFFNLQTEVYIVY